MRTSQAMLGTCRQAREEPADATPEQFFTSSLPLIQRAIHAAVRRYRLSCDDAEEFASTVYVRLIEGDYRILRRFERRSTLATFLNVVVARICLDFRNREWGKWRPSANARHGGSLAVLLERLLDRDGLSLDQADEMLRARHRITLSHEALSDLAATLRVRARGTVASDDALVNMPDPAPRPDELVVHAESARHAAMIRQAIRRAVKALEPRDRALIELRFRTGLGVVEIARTLQLDQRRLYRQFDAVFRGLRRRLACDQVVAVEVRRLHAHGPNTLDLPNRNAAARAA